MPICPSGHTTQSTDYCDTCGMPVGPPSPAAAAPQNPGLANVGGGSAATTQPCPHCGAPNPADALFCEACGYDFTTGTLPRAATEAADLLSIDTPLSAAPAAQTAAPAAPVAPAPSAASAPAAADSGSAGVTPATTAEALEVAADEGMPVAPGAEAPAAVRTSEGDVPATESADQADAAAQDSGAAGVTPATIDEALEVAADEGMPVTPGADAPAAQRTSDAAPVEATPAAVAPAAPNGPVTHVAEIWVDPEWYRVQQSSETMPSPGLPDVAPLHGRQALIGRTSASRNIHPDIECGQDSGVSRRQAQLTFDGQRWFVEDLDSANGTYVGGMTGGLPETPIQGRRELADGDRIYVGAWTRIVLREATPDERAAFAG